MSEIPLLVDGAWLEDRLDDPRLRVFDTTVNLTFPDEGYYQLVSGREAYERAHVPGAAFADLLGALADPGADQPFTVPPSDHFAAAAGSLGIGEDSIVVVYDQYDPSLPPEQRYQHWAGRLWWHLRLEGFDRVAVLDGGLAEWLREGRPIESGSATYPPAEFTARRRPELVATKGEVQDAISNDDVLLLNTVDPDTHSGETLTFSRRGRIPGSSNLYYEDIFDPATGRFLPTDELRRRFEAAGALEADRTITYCGSGIAAAVEAFALATVGNEDVAVYDGSLTEWTADPALPLEVDLVEFT